AILSGCPSVTDSEVKRKSRCMSKPNLWVGEGTSAPGSDTIGVPLIGAGGKGRGVSVARTRASNLSKWRSSVAGHPRQAVRGAARIGRATARILRLFRALAPAAQPANHQRGSWHRCPRPEFSTPMRCPAFLLPCRRTRWRPPPPAGKDTRGPFPVASQGTDLSSEGASRKRTSTAREGPRPGQPLHTALLLMLPLQGKEPHAPNHRPRRTASGSPGLHRRRGRSCPGRLPPREDGRAGRPLQQG